MDTTSFSKEEAEQSMDRALRSKEDAGQGMDTTGASRGEAAQGRDRALRSKEDAGRHGHNHQGARVTRHGRVTT